MCEFAQEQKGNELPANHHSMDGKQDPSSVGQGVPIIVKQILVSEMLRKIVFHSVACHPFFLQAEIYVLA